MPSSRFLILASGILLSVCAGYSAWVLSTATWGEARQLDLIFPFYNWRIQPFSAIELSRAWQLLAGSAALLLVTAVVASSSRVGRSEVSIWWSELRESGKSVCDITKALSAGEQRIATFLFVALTGLRLVLSLPAVTPGYDDVPSYELFASKSLLAVSAYYPVPNNHVLSNTVSWLFFHLNTGFWFTMRLPVLLVATGATALLFSGLLWARAGFRPAVLATLLFSLSQLGLYHAATGRGYWLLTLLAGVVFFCTLALSRPQRLPRAAWTGLVAGGILGAYTVPTFALVLVSAFSWLGLGILQRKSYTELTTVLAMGATIVAGTLLLYTPLLVISGTTIFFSNGFVAPHPWAEFCKEFLPYLWQTEGFLAGQMTVGAVLTLAGIMASIRLRQLVKPGQLPEALLVSGRNLLPAALWFMISPYLLIIVQRVFAPSRTLFYKSYFFFIILALVLEWLLCLRKNTRQQQLLHLALGLSLILWFGYQLGSLLRDNERPQKRNQALHEAFQWLDSHPRAPVLIPESTQNIFVKMYMHSERAGQKWPIDAYPQPGTMYTYVMAFPEQHGQFQPQFAFPPVFHNDQADIYLLPSSTAKPANKGLLPYYWHLAE